MPAISDRAPRLRLRSDLLGSNPDESWVPDTALGLWHSPRYRIEFYRPQHDTSALGSTLAELRFDAGPVVAVVKFHAGARRLVHVTMMPDH